MREETNGKRSILYGQHVTLEAQMKFPIDLGAFKALKFSTSLSELTDEQAKQLRTNIEVVRDSIVFFTAYANTKGLGLIVSVDKKIGLITVDPNGVVAFFRLNPVQFIGYPAA
jgi:hypothetical protein